MADVFIHGRMIGQNAHGILIMPLTKNALLIGRTIRPTDSISDFYPLTRERKNLFAMLMVIYPSGMKTITS